MRTTLDIDDGVLAAAKAMAADSRSSVGAALSLLAKRGLERSGPAAFTNGFPVFAPAPGAKPITLEIVNAARDE